ncbi:MAG: glycoside hydrolase family 2 protein [Tannerellaceae bacterium]|jgi:beta-galactosidase|nr:glycoside hydrolase family 2 protein [Tannerellaceae bacterium]
MKTAVCLSLLFFYTSVFASRKEIRINDDWHFRFAWQVQQGSGQRVNLPHTWNSGDAPAGKPDYHRGIGNYDKQLYIEPEWEGKRLFLRFEGANTVTNLFINDMHVGEHRGGYGAFVFEITDQVRYGAENRILVRVNNAPQLDVMPLVGDFNIYGGIYRDVHLVVVEPVHLSLTDYASSGVYLIQENVTKEQAEIKARIVLSNGTQSACPVDVRVKLFDGKRFIQEQSLHMTAGPGTTYAPDMTLSIPNPRLWNGRKDPFMYRVDVSVAISGGEETDRISQPLGLRFFHVDPEKGFFLNGEPLKLQGVCRHQDRAERGAALYPEHHEEDAAILTEMGANAVRLSHYPQASYFYDLMDKNGIIVWTEIPFVGPGGYQDRGFVDQPSFRDNGKEQLKELIRQHYNHPSICFWGLFNELKTAGDHPLAYVKELNALAHQEDPTRLTTAASFLPDDDPIGQVTDLIAWNKYYGWYGGSPDEMGEWADNAHKNHPDYKMGVSEYGAGASIYHQQDSVLAGTASGWWHPENYQTYYHIRHWQAIAERPFIWGSFLWILFDFGAAHRSEGDRPGINDKGLVSFDRKVKKDAFYFYKANWNRDDKFVYIAARRHRDHALPETGVMVFSNLPETELFVNGKSMGKQSPDNYSTFRWTEVPLEKGANTVEVKGIHQQRMISDHIIWNHH